jgi:glucokinase
MLRYLHNHHRHVSYERVCSGIGLPNIYRYLRDSKGSESPDVAAQLAEASDPTPVIVNAAITRENPCPICVQTLDMFLDILGAEAGNLALKVMATGGIYIGGGILPRILKALKSERLMQTFCNKGRFAEFLGNVPMYIILNPQAALLGAARYGLKWG